MHFVSKQRHLVVVLLAAVLAVSLIGCSRGRDGDESGENPVAGSKAGVVITGNRVDFNQTFTGIDSVGIQVRLSNVPSGFRPTVTVTSALGQKKVLAKAAVSFGGVALAYSGTDLFEVGRFQSLEFSEALPKDAVVEVVDLNAQPGVPPRDASFRGIRGAFIGFRKRFDINNDQAVNTSDLALVLSWIQTSRSSDLAVIKSRALEIFPPVSGSVATLPAVLGEDLNADAAVDTKDIALVMAWIQ